MREGHRLRFPRSARLRRGAEIRALVRGGTRLRTGTIDVYQGPSATGRPRTCVIVPRFDHSIVARNRVKRRLRECLRTTWLPAVISRQPAPEVVVRARPGAYRAPYSVLCEDVSRCVTEIP